MSRPESTRKCDNCARPHYAHGLCRIEYRKVRRDAKLEPKTSTKTCDKCDRKMYALGLCKRHYFRQRYHDPLKPRCKVIGCDHPRHARGLCIGCDKKARRNQMRLPCKLDGCNRISKAQGLCNTHYMRVLNGTDPESCRPLAHSRRLCKIENCDRDVMARGYASSDLYS